MGNEYGDTERGKTSVEMLENEKNGNIIKDEQIVSREEDLEPGVTDPLMEEKEGRTMIPNGVVKTVTEAEKNKKNDTLILEIEAKKLADSSTTLGGGSKDGKGEVDRGSWGGKMEFLFTCIGYAVGLGNVWRFPYLCYKNGGGAFLVPYIIMLACVGLPLFYLELAFGQFASLGPIAIWKINPLFKGLGYSMVCVSWLIAVYYNVIISHTMLYLFASFASIPTQLPWISCDNWWNTPDCIAPAYAAEQEAENTTMLPPGEQNGTESSILNATNAAVFNTLNHTLNGTGIPKTPAEEYYTNFVLEMSSGIDAMDGVNWKLALCLLLSWIIVLICLIRGIQSLGKVVYFTAIFPYIMLTILLIRGATLPGAINGVIYYLKPDFSRLADSRVWSDAATQIFYSLSACSGGLIAMSSYNKFGNNCYKDSLIVALINCATSIYAGLVIFCVLGFMAMEKGVSVADVAAGGPGLAFVVYPEAISRMPAPQLWAIFFFFMMATLGFGSQFSIVECVLSAFTDEFARFLRGKWESILFRCIVILITFLCGLPMVTRGGIYLLNLVDYSVSGFPLLFVGFFELTVLCWIYGFDRFSEDIKMMLGRRPNIYWKVCWMAVSPVIIAVTIVFNCIWYTPPSLDDYTYPEWAQSLGWCIGLFPIMLIPAFFLFRFCRDGGFVLMRELMKPTTEWGPAMLANRTDMYASDVPPTPMSLAGDLGGEMNFFNYNNVKELNASMEYIPAVTVDVTPCSSRYASASDVRQSGSVQNMQGARSASNIIYRPSGSVQNVQGGQRRSVHAQTPSSVTSSREHIQQQPLEQSLQDSAKKYKSASDMGHKPSESVV